MVRITEELIRKRAEHNELMISTLEELSLHQLDIERIEHLDRWCRDLKILYLQYNLIPRIEHVSRLKQLDYLNLALNNIECIEGLDGCEKLRKLDLTANFIGTISSVEHLRGNEALRELYLTGNPCTAFEGYRAYVVAALPQLRSLDGEAITPTERLRALQQYARSSFLDSIARQERQYEHGRDAQKREFLQQQQSACGNVEKADSASRGSSCTVTEIADDEQAEQSGGSEVNKRAPVTEADVWAEKEPFTPESRLATYKTLERIRGEKDKTEKSRKTFSAEIDVQCGGTKPTKRTYFNEKTGAPLNVNEAKLDFRLEDNDDESNCFVLHVPVYKHMDSSLVLADVQPDYVQVTIKGKTLQLVLPEGVRACDSKASRSVVTGELIVTMPKARPWYGKPRVESKPAMKEHRLPVIAQQTDSTIADSTTCTTADTSLLDLEYGTSAPNSNNQQRSLTEKLKFMSAGQNQQQTRPVKPHKISKKFVAEMDEVFENDARGITTGDHDSSGSNCDGFLDDDTVPPLEAVY